MGLFNIFKNKNKEKPDKDNSRKALDNSSSEYFYSIYDHGIYELSTVLGATNSFFKDPDETIERLDSILDNCNSDLKQDESLFINHITNYFKEYDAPGVYSGIRSDLEHALKNILDDKENIKKVISKYPYDAKKINTITTKTNTILKKLESSVKRVLNKLKAVKR